MTEDDINADPNVEVRVHKAKKLVHALATGTNRVDGKLAIFGMEERAVHLVLAALDAEGDGRLTDEERNKYEDVGQKLVDRTMQMCLNSLVVAALLISLFTPYAFEDLQVSEKAEEYFSERFRSGLQTLHDTLITLMISSNICIFMASVYILTVLMSWLPQLDAQQWWISNNHGLLMFVQVIVPLNISLVIAALTVPAGLLVSPRKGLIATFTIACVLSFYIGFIIPNQASCRAMQVRQARRIFRLPTDDVPSKLFKEPGEEHTRTGFRCLG